MWGTRNVEQRKTVKRAEGRKEVEKEEARFEHPPTHALPELTGRWPSPLRSTGPRQTLPPAAALRADGTGLGRPAGSSSYP